MKRNDFCNALSNSNLWKADRFGNYLYIGPKFSPHSYRFKIQTTSARLEFQVIFADGRKEWRNYRSDYFKNIVIDENGFITFGTSTVKQKLI